MDIISPFLQRDSKYFVSYVIFILAIPAGASFSWNAAKPPQNINLIMPRNGDTQMSFLVCPCICVVRHGLLKPHCPPTSFHDNLSREPEVAHQPSGLEERSWVLVLAVPRDTGGLFVMVEWQRRVGEKYTSI